MDQQVIDMVFENNILMRFKKNAIIFKKAISRYSSC